MYYNYLLCLSSRYNYFEILKLLLTDIRVHPDMEVFSNTCYVGNKKILNDIKIHYNHNVFPDNNKTIKLLFNNIEINNAVARQEIMKLLLENIGIVHENIYYRQLPLISKIYINNTNVIIITLILLEDRYT